MASLAECSVPQLDIDRKCSHSHSSSPRLAPAPGRQQSNSALDVDLCVHCISSYKFYMLSAIAHARHPSHNLETVPPPALSREVLPIVTTRSMGYGGEWKRKSNDSGAGDVTAPCGPKPRSTCITAWPCNCSCVGVVVVDGIQAIGPGWPLASEETVVRLHGRKAHHVHFRASGSPDLPPVPPRA